MESLSDTLLPTREGEPSDKMDSAAVVGQWLHEVDLIDLVVELVQNDLDAGATRTVIDFGERALICEGNGRPFDKKGWLRLESVLGAGGEVEAKKDGIGSKNHGLRSAFLLADRIGVQSGGLRADLTVRGNLKKPARFKPAYWPRIEDATSPLRGTRITAPYRTKPLRRPDGDNTLLEPPTSDELDALWQEAVEEAAERFLTASTPGEAWSYTLVLARHGKASHELRYDCKPLSGALRGLWARTCRLLVRGTPAKIVARRHALKFPIAVTDGGKIPKLFRSRGRLYGELSWSVSSRNKLHTAFGRLRYPIAFPGEETRSGHGFDISAPFIAGRARHNVSNDGRNADLVVQGRKAMVEAGPRLAKAYGAALGDLVRSHAPREIDRKAERMLVSGWLDHGGISVIVFVNGNFPKPVKSVPVGAGTAVVLARGSRRQAAIDETLCSLAAGGDPVVSLEHAEVVLDILQDMVTNGDGRISRFDEEAAARAVFIAEIQIDRRIGTETLLRAQAALACLDSLRKGRDLPGSLVNDLSTKGGLPTYSEVAVIWATARRHDHTPPEIPGLRSPPVVHPHLKNAPILNQGPLTLKRFDLNDFVSTRNFSNVIDAGKLKFFNWLRDNAQALKASALARIAAYPIWPSSDGRFLPINAFCRPKARKLREILADNLVAPASSVITLLSTSSLPAGVLKIREQPTEEEVLGWHATRQAELGIESVSTLRPKLDALEVALEWLWHRDPAVVKSMGPAHKTLSQAGELLPVATLHVPNANTLACGLPAKDLCRPKRAELYEYLGAYPKPTPSAIVAALRDDPDPAKLFIRLEAYRARGLSPADLASESIILVDGVAHAGETLAFAGEPDFWGDWKIRLSAGDVAQHHGLLAQLGVIRSNPTRDASLAFFRWLANQSRTVQREHHTQIARHWRERQIGPPSWAPLHLDVPCLPVTGKRQAFELVSLATARTAREDIYLDDFPEIRDSVLKESKARLTLIKAPGFQYSNLDVYAAISVPSLRRASGAPRAISTSGELRLVPDLDLELSRLQSGVILASLKTRLPLHGIKLSDLRTDWQKLMKALKGVRLSGGLTAVYRFLGASYEVPIAGGVDPASSLICLSADSDRQNEFYAVLAAHIFRPGVGESSAWGLMRAARDRRQLSLFETQNDEDGDDVEIGEAGRASEQGSGDVHEGHGLSPTKLKPVVPNPHALGDITEATFLKSTKRRRKAAVATTTDNQRNSVEEEEQKRELKHNHYGYHCQACIGEMDVLKAAPPGTYVFSPGYRQRLLHAHHAHQMQNKGMIGGKNLIILCEYHHRIWGDRLSRENVLAGLSNATIIRRHFPRDTAGKELERREGLLVVVTLDVEPFEAKLYFTKLHAAAWCGGG
jgi:hypothetical protein